MDYSHMSAWELVDCLRRLALGEAGSGHFTIVLNDGTEVVAVERDPVRRQIILKTAKD